jgi:hypothetical protein
MSKSDSYEQVLLKLYFQAVTDASIASAAGSLASLYVSLHSADPGEAGNQSSSELGYTGYSRISVARSTSGWSYITASQQISPVADITFGFCSTHTQTVTATHFAIGRSATGAGAYDYSGNLNPQIAIVTGTTPRITASGTSIVED